jgi:hypothetical protein
MIIKASWNASNHNLNSLPKVITIQSHILCFEIRELNLQAIALSRENRVAPGKLLPSGTVPAAPLSSQLSRKPSFMGPQNRRDSKHPDCMNKDIGALLADTQDATHHLTIYNGMWEIIKPKSHTMTYRSEEQLHPIELWIYHGINAQVESL